MNYELDFEVSTLCRMASHNNSLWVSVLQLGERSLIINAALGALGIGRFSRPSIIGIIIAN